MAREVDVFGKTYMTHDFDAGHDPKCTALILKLGLAAYARWWLLLECLGRSSVGAIDLAEPGQREVLEGELFLTRQPKVTLDAFLADLATFKLIDADALSRGHVLSPAFLRRQGWLMAKSEAGAKGGRPKKAAADGEDGDDEKAGG